MANGRLKLPTSTRPIHEGNEAMDFSVKSVRGPSKRGLLWGLGQVGPSVLMAYGQRPSCQVDLVDVELGGE